MCILLVVDSVVYDSLVYFCPINPGKKDKTNGNYGIESVQEGCCETDTIGLETAANSGLSSGPVQMINSMESVGSSAKDLDNRSRVGFLKFDIEETPFGPKNNGNDTHQMADLCARVDALGTQMQVSFFVAF